MLSWAFRIPTQADVELAELGTSEEDQKILELAELNQMAYEDMLLSMDTDTKAGQVAFDLVKNAKTPDHPEGNCYVAMKKLQNKYDPRTGPSYVAKKREFTNSKLESCEEDPDEWITDLETLRSEMDAINISGKMSNIDFIVHILANLPEE